MTEDAALFTSAYNALVFAYNYNDATYGRSMMSKMASSSGDGNGLGGLDGAAQAGIIKSKTRVLGPFLEAALIVRVAIRSMPCHCLSSCCSGQKINKEWQSAMWLLTNTLDPKITSKITHYLRVDFVIKHYFQDVTFVDLENVYKINHQTLSKYMASISKTLKQNEQTAWAAITESLKEAGLI